MGRMSKNEKREVGPEDITPGPPAYFEWQGIRWYRRPKSGHYADRTGTLLYVAIWEYVHQQRLPDGYLVHHKNHDPASNWSSNLQALTRVEHLEEHGLLGAPHSDPVRAAMSAQMKESWTKREPRPYICAYCGTKFMSTGQRAKFCSPNHRMAFAREQRRNSWSQS